MSDEDRLRQAQAAMDRRDFVTAYEALVELQRSGLLDGEGLYALSDAAWWLGLIRETIEICEECHERFLAEGQVDRAAMVALETGMQWAMRGEPDVGSGWLSRARRLLDGRPSSVGHGYLLWIDAEGRFAAGDVDGALAGAVELQRLAVELDQPVLGCFGLALHGMVAIRAGETSRGFELLDEALLPVLAGRVGPAESGNLYCQMISICTDLGDLSRARRWTEATERWCDQFSSAVMFTGICRVHRAQLLRVQGDWDEAERAAAAACAELADLNVEAVAEAHYEIGESRRHRGDLAGAAAAYEQAAALGRLPEPGRSLLLLAEGRRDQADASVRSALAEQADPFRRARLLAAQVEIACRRADVATADAATAELEAIADTYGSPGFTAWAKTARAEVLLGSGAPADAVAPLREALAAYRRMGARPEEATTRTLLERAVAGAAAPPAAPGGLTAREWEILCAVAEGLSNREVAARLVISEKTVARHLANVYAKLGVPSRTAAAAWAHQEGLH
ncbi:response regulator transcription factor [Nocardioides bizhenqiangii]|uniref:Response regulator transcription factor n=1 Tax=Nocardioides bizhenqiangii TaxID=3095076 RepID=A0ABZ0ZV34_9ACTN|nr:MULTISPECIES: response regulator transcription factor [unclassified Nocardioides]MDZ5623187.1 response regulator transcription factor [Nocardioides sp. HM23]WQQ28160.1 response regulator transcription factor [Nocardioides sp. HM61]